MSWNIASSPKLSHRVGCVLVVVFAAYFASSVLSVVPVIDRLLCEIGRLVWTTLASGGIFWWIRYRNIAATRLRKVSSAGKAVLITGCDSGFGFETALRLYCEGFHVFAGCLQVGINGALTLENVDNGQRLVPLALDVTNSREIDAAFDLIQQSLVDNRLDFWAVINNAGITSFCELELCDLDRFQKILDVNTLGTVRVSQRFLPLLRRSHGRLIIINSLAGYLSYAGLTAYCMSKHALVGFADCVRKEFAKWEITVSSIVSTGYRTNMLDPVAILRDMEDNWKSASDEVHAAYGGEEYFQSFQRAYLQRLTSVTSHVGEAIDAIIAAVQAEVPQEVYYTSWRGELRSLARFLPMWGQNLYMRLFESFEPFFTFLTPNTLPPKNGKQLLEEIRRQIGQSSVDLSDGDDLDERCEEDSGLVEERAGMEKNDEDDGEAEVCVEASFVLTPK